ncbi:hypothetical protein [Pseudomonas sp. RA_35y_Pfl2_P32]|uniref:hypothetical protein n=1 Tax=Pseudomonas sp. RA_35y_Pfl2_P32 TaxID=3088705 RepID=UPI0030D769E5
MTDYTELKRLAEAAPEGPWFGPEYAPGTSYVFDVDLGTLPHYESIDTEQDACLRYVAAANPAVVLALITENENLVAWREGLLKERAAHIRQRDQIKAENEALLEAMTQIMRVTKIGDEAFDIACLVVGELCADAAMSKGEQS